MKYFSTCLFIFTLLSASAQSPARITEEERELVTYPYSDPNPVGINLKTSKIYPYTLFEGYSKTGKKRKWKVVKLENDYIEVYVLPEVGGKIWGAIEKSTGKEFIYRNEVIKFRNIAMRGPWTSGGIEFNFGIIGHHPSTASPVDYTTTINSDGSVSCIVGNLDLPSRTNWRVEIRLPKDKAYVETNASWNNPTPIHQSYYNWMTAAAVVSDDLEFYYPGNLALEHDGSPTPWPLDQGRDLSKYNNNAFGSHKSIHTVGEYNDYMAGYYQKSKFGFGHWALYDEMPGHKLWLWALSRSGGIWEDLLTDTDGQYMEFQAGRQLNQYAPSSSLKSAVTQAPFSPGATDRWTELWFPIKETGGVTDVSPLGVMNVNGENISLNSLAFVDATIEVKIKGKTVYSEKKVFKPMDVFQLKMEGDEVIVKEMDLHYKQGQKELLKRPFVATPAAKELTADALYRQAVEYKEAREYRKASTILRQCLKNDSLHFGALNDLAELHYRSGLYDSALLVLSKVLRHDTYDPKANYVAGISYKAKGDLVNAIESLGWAARAMEFRSAAYAQMASVQITKGNYDLAGHYANESLSYNRYNFNALHDLLVICRKTARKCVYLEEIDQLDKLDHFAQYEKFQLTRSGEDDKKFTGLIRNEFPYQTYIEIALEYLSMGLKDDATTLLSKAPANPEVTIWLAYLKNDTQLLKQVATESPAFVFPYRTESLAPLQWAVSQNDNWRFKSFLALNYYALQRDSEALDMFSACGDQPDYAAFYLTRSKLLKDQSKIAADLTKANKIAPGEWRTWSYLIEHYEKTGNYEQELSYARQASQKFKDDYTLGFALAKAQLNNKQYKASIETLHQLNVLPFEGSGEGHEVYEQVHLLRAVELMEGKKYKDALKEIQLSNEWPENLGEGKPYDVDTRLQDYMTAVCSGKLGKPAEGSKITIQTLRENFKGPRYKEIIDRLWKLEPKD
jgi:Flp pilus assembly protein TadD